MVVFTCSNCGDAVKKPQVEKHTYKRQCRGAVFSCVDCFKDFHGMEYQTHNSCISENQRYGGKNFVPTESLNKGQLKQQQWFENVLQAIEKCKAQQPPKIKSIFEQLKGYPNIPSKKAKFESFLKSSMRIWDIRLASQVWEAIDQNVEKKPPLINKLNGKTDNSGNEPSTTPNGRLTDTDVENKSDDLENVKEGEIKLNKRERKEQRQIVQQKKKRKEVFNVTANENYLGTVKTKKKKKKHEETVEEDEEYCCKKKRKLDETEDSLIEENMEVAEENYSQEDYGEPAKKRFKTKFDWSGVITEVLKEKDKEIKIKKLRKKVLAEYLSQGCTEKSEEKLWAKFDKKLKKNPLFKIQSDRVKLKM